MPKPLTSTSRALLGLLALRPWTTYELAKQMERSLHHFWPRAESELYKEAKNLVAHGLARSRTEHRGRRPRTVYAITPKGRRDLEKWLAEPGSGPTVEFEALVKVFFADQATKQDLLVQLRAVQSRAADGLVWRAGVIREYPETGGPFPERLHIIALVTQFLTDQGKMILQWARWAESEVLSWPDTRHAEVDPEVFRRMIKEGKDSPHVGGN